MNSYQSGFPINVSPYQQNIDIVKGYFKRPLVLVNAILLLASLIISIITVCLSLNSLPTVVRYEGYPTVQTPGIISTIFVGILAGLPSLLIAVCWFLIYTKSKSSNPTDKPSAPFKILWVLSIVGLVCLCLLTFLLLGILLLALLGVLIYNSSHNYPSDIGIPILIGWIIFIAILMAISIIFCVFQMRYFQSVKNSMQNINLYKNGAMAYGVMTIVFSSFSIIYLLISLAAGALFAGLVPPGYSNLFSGSNLMIYAVSTAVSAAAGLVEGIIAIGYSSYISKFISGVNTASVNQPYSNPVNPESIPPQAQFAAPPAEDAFQYRQTYVNSYNNRPVAPREPQPPVEYDSYADVKGQNPYLQADESVQTNQNVAPAQESTPQVNPGVCPNCGSPVFRSDMFCNNCGTKLK